MSTEQKEYARGGKIVRTCPVCNKMFLAVSPDRVYCSYECKRRVQNERYYHTHQEEIIERNTRNQKGKKK